MWFFQTINKKNNCVDDWNDSEDFKKFIVPWRSQNSNFVFFKSSFVYVMVFR